MENLEKIKEFINTGSGYGYGYGGGDGGGDGYGSGSGSGSGSGYGGGSGSGSGYGYGYGDGFSNFNGSEVYKIDGVATIIKSVHGNFAKAFVLNNDLTLTPCYIAKLENLFAHGKTLDEAYAALQDKLLENMPVEDRIDKFLQEFKPGTKYSNKLFFNWHHILTDSCLFGRQQFCKNKGIDLDGETTVEEFIELTKNDYGSNIIRLLEKRLKQ